MANYANLLATIAANIYTNGNQEVTAAMVKTAMNEVVNTLGAGYQYMGIAHPEDAAVSYDQHVFFIATEPGTYTNKGGLQVAEGEVAILKFDTAWHKEVTGAATAAQVAEFGKNYYNDLIKEWTSIFRSLSYDTSAVQITEHPSTYLGPNGDLLPISNANYNVLEVSVSPGDFYIVDCATSPVYNSQIAFYNNTEVVANFVFSESINLGLCLFIPFGVNKLYVQRRNDLGAGKIVVVSDIKKIDYQQFQDTALRSKFAENTILQIASPTDKTLIQQTIQQNSYLTSTGRIAAISSNFQVGICDVTPGTVYQFEYHGYVGNAGFAFVDGAGNVLSLEIIENTAEYYERVLIAPYGASQLRIQYRDDVFDVYKYSDTYVPANTANNKWSGKKWVVFGDSLTEVNSRATKRYYDYVSEKTGISIYNMGVSGTGYKRGNENNTAFFQRISACPTDADVITIFGSFNDNLFFTEIGQITDTGTDTLSGCVNTCLDNLFSVFPLANLGIVSPTPWVSAYPGLSGPDNYVQMLKDICLRRGIPYYDLYHDSSLRPWDATYRALCYTRDDGNGVHPDETGHKIIAPRFEAFLDSLLLH